MMQLTKWDPFGELDDVFGRRGRGFGWPLWRKTDFSPFDEESWSPRVDISETDDQVMIKAEMPGVKRDEVKVSVADNTLIIHGERKEEKKEEGRVGFTVLSVVMAALKGVFPCQPTLIKRTLTPALKTAS